MRYVAISVAGIFIISLLKFHLYLKQTKVVIMTNIWSSTRGFVWVSDEQVFYAGASGSGPTSSVDKANCVTVVNLED